jgi:transketolase
MSGETSETLEVDDFITRAAGPVRRYYGEALVAAAFRDPRIVCLGADLSAACEVDLFRDRIPDRFFQVGIAEANMIGMARGMADMGDIPFVHTFATFASKRCFDQVSMQAAYGQAPVKIAGFLPGISTLLGVSHQAIEDVALMRTQPGMVVLEPSGVHQFAATVEAALAHSGPVYMRLKRPEAPPPEPVDPAPVEIGRGRILREGDRVALIASGMMVAEAEQAAEQLEQEGISVALAEMPSIKPLDSDLVLRLAGSTGRIVTVENHTIVGGLGSAVAEVIAERAPGARLRRVGLMDTFAEGGSTPFLFAKYGLDARAIASAARSLVQDAD